MKRFEIKEFCGYEVTINEDENYIDYILEADEFYNENYSNTFRGRIMLEVNCEILRALREAFQNLIKEYYAQYDVAIIIPDGGEEVVIRKTK